LEEGDAVKVTGARVTIGEMTFLVAKTVARGDEILVLRDFTQKSGLSKEVLAEAIGFDLATKGSVMLRDIVRPLGKEVEAFREALRLKGSSLLKSEELVAPPPSQIVAASGKVFDADQVRGPWTLDELVKKSGIPKEKFAQGVGFPVETAGTEKLRDLAAAIGKSVEYFREIVL
jgi:hypothetical protein